MGKQIKLLTRIALCNLMGFNEFRYTKDRKKKFRYYMMGCLCFFLIIILMGYVSGISYGLIYMGLGAHVPAILSMCVALFVFIFTMLKAGTVLFDQNAYEKQITLPVTVRAMIISRFLPMYISDMLLGLLVMVPGIAVYGIMEQPDLSFYLYGFLGSLFLPFLPLTLASVVGAVITGISSRWRRKNLVAILLTMLFVCILLLGSFTLSGMEPEQLTDIMQKITSLIDTQIRNVYPPGIWLSEAMVQGNLPSLLLFLAISTGCFLLFLELLRPFYVNICNLLAAHEARRNYQMKDLSVRSVLWSMIDRELRRYFASVVYVVNTLTGNILALLLSIAILIMGKETLNEIIGIQGIAERGLPVLLGMIFSLMPMSSCSISMEGKQWWMMQTFPVSEKDIMKSKVGANLLVALPFYLVSEILLIIALRPAGLNFVCLLAIPAVYIIFLAVTGFAVNRKFPLLDWENEVRVVKQSTSTLLTMLIGMTSGMVPLFVLVAFQTIPAYVIYGVLSVILLGIAGILWGIQNNSSNKI
ncbi:MAG: hypothetical protein HFH82_13950 [Lachnospiraceae bacterium]|nr:hypothetical protein [Lachnospiraceae bacterium]